MKGYKSQLTGDYTKELTNQISRIEKRAKNNISRKIVFFLLMIAISAGGLFYGVSDKENTMKMQYKEYEESPDQSKLTPELLSYKDTYKLFVDDYLGNNPSQSMMGGYFYSDVPCIIHPNKDATGTIITIDNKEYEMTAYLADNINVRGDYVFFRNPVTREILSYDITEQKTTPLGIFNVGQFVVCGDDYYYIDLLKSSLEKYNNETKDNVTIVESGISSFVIAGNNIIYLDVAHTLNSYNLKNAKVTALGENITAFAFNGSLWIQNNSTVYQKNLIDKRLTEVDLGLQCNRLLGATDSDITFESVDGVYVYSISDNINSKLGNDLFIGACNNMVLWYNSKENKYFLDIK